ncbi:PKD_channel domain-containing protein, partial [Haematococcus lacustris]
LGGIGSDPVFNPRSSLYNPQLNASDWYNSSAGAGELSMTQVPYAFFHHPLPGLEAGYPVLVDTGISAKRSAQVLSYLLEGGYVDTGLTDSMGVQLVTYNPTAAVFGRWRLSLDWQPDGSILGTHQLQALPAIEYSANARYWHKIVKGVLEIEGEEADALRHATYGKGRRQPLHRHTQWSYAS